MLVSVYTRLAPNVEAGVETTISAGMKPVLNEMMQPVYQTFVDANTSIGAKYEYRQSVYRGQINSNGEVAFLLEHRVLPTLGLLVSASMDHVKNTCKLGAGLQVDVAGSEEVMMMQNNLIDANGNPIEGAQLA
ncbi:unnamed protein product [Ambrosiozyma monospora]|uniref:Unnamed protein product n=1 Tax=Ambrosiozyma monospora TaxID=43982 RepID=A0A9W6T5N2_AMBMO|nr:unnamed protein product [Ambrosiozyma monospora]